MAGRPSTLFKKSDGDRFFVAWIQTGKNKEQELMESNIDTGIDVPLQQQYHKQSQTMVPQIKARLIILHHRILHWCLR
jgi:hypothetical protein